MAQIFPKSSNDFIKVVGPALFLAGGLVTFVIWFWFSPEHTDVGYEPDQPIPYSHELHAGELGMDCRYCHNNVERSAYAGVPPTQTCLNCHSQVRKELPAFRWFRQAQDAQGNLKPDAPSTPWVRVHKLGDYAYFDHSAHVLVGVGCQSCHGQVDKMVKVRQVEPLSMGWCLECHRNVSDFEARGFEPADVLRPPDVAITDMTWGEDHPAYAPWKEAAKVKAQSLNPPIVNCSGCHR